jgi:hypothetical protein
VERAGKTQNYTECATAKRNWRRLARELRNDANAKLAALRKRIEGNRKRR